MQRRSGVDAARPQSAAELKRILALTRAGEPFLVFHDATGAQVELVLRASALITIGRDAGCQLALPWDTAVSRLHAELVCRAGAWMVQDDGLSKNGTFVNGQRLHGRRRLLDNDVLLFGSTTVVYRRPLAGSVTGTAPMSAGARVHVSPAQRKVLIELCRPFAEGAVHAVPPSNRAIAAALVLSDDAVKSHMRALFGRFGIEGLPQNAKRAKLVELALHNGIVTPRDLR